MVILSFTLGYALLTLHGSLVTTSLHRVPLRFTLGYALLRLQRVLVAMFGMGRTLNVLICL